MNVGDLSARHSTACSPSRGGVLLLRSEGKCALRAFAGASIGMIRRVVTSELANSSVIGRLLEEVSWEGAGVRAYRDGGRGRENVLTAEVLSPLAYLPRSAFLGEVLRSAHGATGACHQAAREIEEAEITLLPDESRIPGTDLVVQPDATMSMPSCHVLVEAKRIRRSAFQAEQLAREYVTLLSDAGAKTPLLLLVIGAPPPVAVQGHGRLDPVEAVMLHLETVVSRANESVGTLASISVQVPDVLAWITWAEIAEIVTREAAAFTGLSHGLSGTVDRLASTVTTAINWHS